MAEHLLLSLVIPCHNEAANIRPLYNDLVKVLTAGGWDYELIFVDDGSRDDTLAELYKLPTTSVRIISLARNFGKEAATSAGIHAARGKATILLDADGQHPVTLIPRFIKTWQDGAIIVTGLRLANRRAGLVKTAGSKLFYRLTSGGLTRADATDFRLIDAQVRRDFNRLTERRRMTRGLIDWLGYPQTYIEFEALPRTRGQASYGFGKLVGLALDGLTTLSMKPLYFTITCGLVVLPLSVILGLFSVIEMAIGDPLGLHITGTAYLVIAALFLLGTVLVIQSITALYLVNIQTEIQGRPLYVVDPIKSRKLT